MDEKSPAPAAEVDLFGDPWTPPKDPRGRKSHKRSTEVAEKVAVLRATGATVEEIANRFGLSEPTLRKYYFRELDQGPAIAKAVMTEALWNKAIEKGNAALIKLVFSLMEEGDALLADGKLRARAMSPQAPASQPQSQPATPKIGKKEQRQATADEIGNTDRFAQSRAPKLVVNNP